MATRPTYPIGINVFAVRDGKLLLGKRKETAGEGMWGLPGGHLEQNESMPGAAARELKEETSLEAGAFRFLNLINDNGDERQHYIQVGFAAEDIKGEVTLMEPERCSEWRWFPLDALPENIFFGHTKQVELFLKHLPFSDTVS